MKKNIAFVLLLAFALSDLPAQYQNPSSLKWMQVKTSNFRVVFPENLSERGIETANLLETAYPHVSRTLNISPRTLPVVLFNQTVISNGYTALAPKHIGFYTTPPQNAALIGGTDWLQVLTLHEFRHAVQFRKLDQNLTTYIGSLTGDIGKAVCMGISIPFWVLEGDAISIETAFSEEGRGRLASFSRDIRALELENKRYSYNKAYLGSYKHYFPNHYYLGYLLTAHIRKNYGAETWSNTIEHTTKFPLYPFIFSHGLKRYTSKSLKSIYQNCLNEFRSIWDAGRPMHTTGFVKVSPEIRSGYTSYSYPFYCPDSCIVALKSGFGDAPVLVSIKKGKETRLIEINPVDRVHSNGKLVTWSSRVADLRWGQRDYADILIYDLTTGELRYLNRKGKYFAPAVSPDGEKIAAIEYGSDMYCSLVVLDNRQGMVVYRHRFDADEFARMPSWSADGGKVAAIITRGQQRKLVVYDIPLSHSEEILPYTVESITNPVFFNDYILFNSPVTGIDAIHSVHIPSGKRFLVSQGMYAVNNVSPSPDGAFFILQNYTTFGNEIVEQSADTKEWTELSAVEIKNDNYFMHLVHQEEGRNIFETTDLTDQSNFTIKRYSPLLNSIKIHSWAPYPVVNGVGFSVLSNDLLNTASLEAGINYFPKDLAHREYVKLSYARFFPVFDAEFSFGRKYIWEAENDSTQQFLKTEINEKIIHLGITTPLDFSQHIYTTTLSPGVGMNYIIANFPDADSTRIGKYDVTALTCKLAFRRSKQLAYRDIHPKFAQEFSIIYWNSPFDETFKGSRLLATGRVFFPGIGKHHSLILTAGYEESNPVFRYGIYQLTSDLEPVRGYLRSTADRIRKATLEYTLPLLYPDMSFGPVMYIKRVSTNLFYDNALIHFDNAKDYLSSAGIDLNFELHFFQLNIPFELGIRYSYAIQHRKHVFDFLMFGVSF